MAFAAGSYSVSSHESVAFLVRKLAFLLGLGYSSTMLPSLPDKLPPLEQVFPHTSRLSLAA